ASVASSLRDDPSHTIAAPPATTDEDRQFLFDLPTSALIGATPRSNGGTSAPNDLASSAPPNMLDGTSESAPPDLHHPRCLAPALSSSSGWPAHAPGAGRRLRQSCQRAEAPHQLGAGRRHQGGRVLRRRDGEGTGAR